MKQLIVGKDVASGVAGAINFFSRNASGVDTLIVNAAAMTALAADEEIRVALFGSDVKSPWMKRSDITATAIAAGAAQTAQSLAMTYANGTAGVMVTVKFIETSAGSEPFIRKSFEVDAAAVGANLKIAMDADMPSFIASVSAGAATIVGTTYAGGDLGLTNIQVAFDANGSGATASVVNTGASEGVGDKFFLADTEKSLLGSAVGDYYRATYLPNPTDVYVLTSGFNYGMYNLSWKNSSVNQINGVDNVRTIILAEENSAAGVAAAATATAAIVAAI